MLCEEHLSRMILFKPLQCHCSDDHNPHFIILLCKYLLIKISFFDRLKESLSYCRRNGNKMKHSYQEIIAPCTFRHHFFCIFLKILIFPCVEDGSEKAK